MTSPPTTAPMGTQSSFATFGGGPQVKPQSPMGMGTTMSPMSSTSRPNYFGGAPPLASTPPIKPATPYATKPTTTSGGSGAFDDLWSMGLGSTSSKPAGPAGGQKSIKDLEKEKQQAAFWGSGSGGASNTGGAKPPAFGGFANNAASGGGGDDLLL